MALLKFFSDLSQTISEFTSKDEMVFGEMIRIFQRKGYPCIGFAAKDGYQSGRFLIEGEVLFAIQVTLDKKVGGAGILNIVAEVRNKMADPDDMISMFKTDLSNVTKIPLLGAIKVNHEYNTIYAKSTSVKKISSYLESRGVVNSAQLESDLMDIVSRLEDTLRKFKKV
jgi:hypothetical protein